MARPASDVTTVRPGGNTRPGLRAPGAPGVKMLISSLALALTVAGWARLATDRQPQMAADPEPTAPAPEAVPVAEVRSISYRVVPLPTLVPLIASQGAVVSARRQAAPVAASAPALGSLRQVAAPPPPPAAPAPVAVTRSSR